MRIEVPAARGAAPAADATAPDVSATSSVAPANDAPQVGIVAARPDRTRPSASAMLAAAWAIGAVLMLVPVVIGLWQVSALRRSALPWRRRPRACVAALAPAAMDARVDVVLHEHVPGPMTCGAIRHAIVLPRDADASADRGSASGAGARAGARATGRTGSACAWRASSARSTGSIRSYGWRDARSRSKRSGRATTWCSSGRRPPATPTSSSDSRGGSRRIGTRRCSRWRIGGISPRASARCSTAARRAVRPGRGSSHCAAIGTAAVVAAMSRAAHHRRGRAADDSTDRSFPRRRFDHVRLPVPPTASAIRRCRPVGSPFPVAISSQSSNRPIEQFADGRVRPP